MATEVLPPQDLLVERFHMPTTSLHRRKNFPATGNLSMNRKQRGRPSPKQDKTRFNAAATEAKRSSHAGNQRRKAEISSSGGLVMGQVTLLRRGESLSSLASKITSNEIPKSKEIAPRKIRLVAAPSPAADIYAGTAFFSSPSPRSVPLPSFFNKKEESNEAFEDGATRFLRRVLRLE